MKRLRSAGCVALLAVLGFCVATTPAVAQPLERDHWQNSFQLVRDQFCGDLTIRIEFHGHGTYLLNPHGPDGLAYVVETFHGTESYTNRANDRTMTSVYNVVSKDQKLTDNGDGTLTIIAMTTGSVRVFGADDRLLAIDSGQMRLKLLIDHGGTPNDPSDDEVLAEFVVKESTGRNDLQGQDFCADLHEAVG